MSKIARLEVKNFERLTAADVEVTKDRGLVVITGANTSGKSSLLDAIKATFFGGRQIRSEAIINKTSEDGKGFTAITLNTGTRVERKYTGKTPKGALHVVTADGGSYTQKTLSEWVGPFAYDLLYFFDLSEADQRAALYSLSPNEAFHEDLAQVEREIQEAYAARTPVRSRLQALQRMTKPEGERPEVPDVSEVASRLSDLSVLAQDRNVSAREVEAASDFYDVCAKSLNDTDEALDRARDEVARLEALQVQRREELVSADRGFEEAKRAYDSRPDPTAEIAAARKTLARAGEVERQAAPWKEWDRNQEELATVAAEDAALTKRVEDARLLKSKMFNGSGIKVPGLSFGPEGEILYHEMPLSAASGRQKVDFATDVAFAANPELRACLVDDGDALDLEALEHLDRRATEEDFQVFITRIGIEGPGEIVVENGVASARVGDE